MLQISNIYTTNRIDSQSNRRAIKRTPCPRSTAMLAEEVTQKRGTGLLSDTVINLGTVMSLPVREHPRPMRHSARFRIRRAVIKPRNPRSRNRPGTHRAGLQGYIKRTTRQPLGLQLCASRANGHDLGMGRRIVKLPRAIARLGQQSAILRYDHGTDRHLSPPARGLGQLKRLIHMGFETHGFCLPFPRPCAKGPSQDPRNALGPAP